MVDIGRMRTPQDDQERYLERVGWKPVGLILYQYPHEELRTTYTKEQALALTEEMGLDMYCTTCGACGEEGCCLPDKCVCLYREHYDKTYKSLLDENELLYKFMEDISELEDSRADERYVLVLELKKKLEEL